MTAAGHIPPEPSGNNRILIIKNRGALTIRQHIRAILPPHIGIWQIAMLPGNHRIKEIPDLTRRRRNAPLPDAQIHVQRPIRLCGEPAGDLQPYLQ